MYKRFFVPILGAAVVAGMAIGCQDLPVDLDTSDSFPLEKLDVVTGDITPEVEFHVREFGFDATESDEILNASVRERGADVRAGRGPNNPPIRGNSGGSDHARDDAASIFRRALASLDLSDRQLAAITECFEEYRACIESARSRARAAREGYYETFRTTVARIRNAASEGTITRQEAREHMHEAIQDYRKSVLALHRALRAAEADCVTSLKDCIESVLTPEQIARFRELISRAHGEGGDRDRDGDDNGRDGDHVDGDRGGDRGGDNSGGDNGRDGDHVDGDRGGDRGGDDSGDDESGDDNGRDRDHVDGDRGGDRGGDDSGDDSGDDHRRDSVRNGRGG